MIMKRKRAKTKVDNNSRNMIVRLKNYHKLLIVQVQSLSIIFIITYLILA